MAERFVNSATVEEVLMLFFDVTGKHCNIYYPAGQKLLTFVENVDVSLALDWLSSKLEDAVRLAGSEDLLFLEYENKDCEHSGVLLSQTNDGESCYIVIWDVDIQDEAFLANYNYLFLLMKIFFTQSARLNKNLKTDGNEFLQLLLEEHSLTDAEIARRMKRYGYPFSPGNSYIIVTSFSSVYEDTKPVSVEENLRQFTPFFEAAASMYRMIGGVSKKNDLFFIVPAEKLPPSQQLAKSANTVKALHESLDRRYTSLSFTSGIGFVQDTIREVHLGYRQAYTALRHTLSLFGKGTLLHFKDMGVFRLLLSNPLRSQIKSFLMDYFEPLLSLEREDVWPLLETVYSYVICGFNSRECARKIYVHHNTVRYRLDKIETLCNLDLKKPADLVTLLVCLEILKLCPDYMQQIHHLETLLTSSDG